MKKTILTSLILTAFTTTAVAQTEPVVGRKRATSKAAPSPTLPDSKIDTTPGPSKTGPILTAEEVARLLLTQSYRATEVNATAGLNRLAYAQVLATYDFSANLASGYQRSQVNQQMTAQNRTWSEDKTYSTTAGLTKPFVTGTTLGIEASRTSVMYDLYPNAVPSIPSQYDRYTQDILGLTLNQNLWNNFFGKADRAEVSSAEKTYEASMVTRVNNLQSLVLEGIQDFWNAYVAQQTFQEALNSRDRYQKLVEAVRRKQSYGYANPGELPQVQAQYEAKVQAVKSSSANYLQAVDLLVTLLNLPKGTQVQFKAVEQITPPPAVAPVSVDNLRIMRAADLNKEAAQKALEGADSRFRPNLSLVGKVYTSGTDQDPQSADNQLMGGTQPRYYVGVQYNYNFGNGTYSEQRLNRRLSRDLTQAQYDRARRETEDDLLNRDRQVQALYNVAISAKNQREYSERAAVELTKTYNQGRTDISIFISALNDYFDAEVAFIRAIGNYQVALNQRASSRDELIPDASPENPVARPISSTTVEEKTERK